MNEDIAHASTGIDLDDVFAILDYFECIELRFVTGFEFCWELGEKEQDTTDTVSNLIALVVRMDKEERSTITKLSMSGEGIGLCIKADFSEGQLRIKGGNHKYQEVLTKMWSDTLLQPRKSILNYDLDCGECEDPAPRPTIYRIVKQTEEFVKFECINCKTPVVMLLKKQAG